MKANWIGHVLRRNWLLNTLLMENRMKDRGDRKTRKKTETDNGWG